MAALSRHHARQSLLTADAASIAQTTSKEAWTEWHGDMSRIAGW